MRFVKNQGLSVKKILLEMSIQFRGPQNAKIKAQDALKSAHPVLDGLF